MGECDLRLRARCELGRRSFAARLDQREIHEVEPNARVHEHRNEPVRADVDLVELAAFDVTFGGALRDVSELCARTKVARALAVFFGLTLGQRRVPADRAGGGTGRRRAEAEARERKVPVMPSPSGKSAVPARRSMLYGSSISPMALPAW